MPLPRRTLLRALPLGFLQAPSVLGRPVAREPGWPLTVTDSVGRQVTLKALPRSILLGTGFHLIALSLLHPDPVGLLAGWPDDLRRYNAPLADAFAARFPRLSQVPLVGGAETGTLSAEQALSVGADLALFGGWQAASGTGAALMQQLAEAGTPSLVVDFTADPLGNTAPGMRLLGRVLGRAAQGEEFARFHESRLEAVRQKVAAHPGPGPGVLLHAFPGTEDCCWVAGTEGIGSLLAAVGGRNLGAGFFPAGSSGGALSLEALVTAEPEVYIATGLPRNWRQPGFSIGPGVPAEAARRSLSRALEGPGLASLPAVRSGRAHGLWNFFNAVPLNILAVEALARWVRPELFPDLDPGATLAEINRRFAAMPFEGSFWISLDPALP